MNDALCAYLSDFLLLSEEHARIGVSANIYKKSYNNSYMHVIFMCILFLEGECIMRYDC